MEFAKIKSHAKINLSLNIIKKIKKNLHTIESLVSFIDLHDLIHLREIKSNKHKVFFTGKFSKGIRTNNTVNKLLEILDKKSFLKGKKFEIKITKNIPQKSGMGGGSMNAASLINFFLKKKIFKLNSSELYKICFLIGSDVILGVKKKNSVLLANRRVKRFEKKIKYFVLVVKPNFGCSTRLIYSKVNEFYKPIYKNPKRSLFSEKSLLYSENRLEKIAFEIYPILKKIKLYLMKLSNVKFVRMSGSGSSIVAYFNSIRSRDMASKKFKKKFGNYWCIKSKTI